MKIKPADESLKIKTKHASNNILACPGVSHETYLFWAAAPTSSGDIAMKYKTTIKALRENATNLRSAGYCDLQYLLTNHNPVAYTSGVYGWNFDVYEVHGLTICTGYRGMPGKRLEGIEEYEVKAAAVWSDYNKSYDERCEAVENLLHEFCKANGGY